MGAFHNIVKGCPCFMCFMTGLNVTGSFLGLSAAPAKKFWMHGSIAGKIECCSCCLQECIGPCGVNQVLLATARVYAWGEPRKCIKNKRKYSTCGTRTHYLAEWVHGSHESHQLSQIIRFEWNCPNLRNSYQVTEMANIKPVRNLKYK